jgi:acyl carrier protein
MPAVSIPIGEESNPSWLESLLIRAVEGYFELDTGSVSNSTCLFADLLMDSFDLVDILMTIEADQDIVLRRREEIRHVARRQIPLDSMTIAEIAALFEIELSDESRSPES